MPEQICCMCDDRIEGRVKTIGSRYYCEKHYLKVINNGKGMWISAAIGIGAVVLYVLTAQLVSLLFPPAAEGAGLIVTGIVMVIVPAGAWLIAFYGMDTLEPEPKEYITGVFLLGVVLAKAVAQPVIYSFFAVDSWLTGQGFGVLLSGSILIIGMVQEYVKYAGVRFTVFMSDEFDERIDGIIYGAAIGLGFAAMLSLDYILVNKGVHIGTGSIRIAIWTLAHASFSGISGYFLGIAKFEDKPFWWLPAGVGAAAVCNGFVQTLLKQVSRQGMNYTPVYGLVLAGCCAAIVFAILFFLTQRANRGVLETTVKGGGNAS